MNNEWPCHNRHKLYQVHLHLVQIRKFRTSLRDKFYSLYIAIDILGNEELFLDSYEDKKDDMIFHIRNMIKEVLLS